uniref:Chromobox 3 n=1 Tax=Melanaphis sacchari TaxID=742174 RepID=A0A2H8TWC5_9HEMI
MVINVVLRGSRITIGSFSFRQTPYTCSRTFANSQIMDNKAIPKKNGKFCLNGFSVGLTPEKIISMKQLKNSERFFLIQWKETNDTTYVNANIANKYCPQLVINFYEEFSLWKDD